MMMMRGEGLLPKILADVVLNTRRERIRDGIQQTRQSGQFSLRHRGMLEFCQPQGDFHILRKLPLNSSNLFQMSLVTRVRIPSGTPISFKHSLRLSFTFDGWPCVK